MHTIHYGYQLYTSKEAMTAYGMERVDTIHSEAMTARPCVFRMRNNPDLKARVIAFNRFGDQIMVRVPAWTEAAYMKELENAFADEGQPVNAVSLCTI